MSSRESARPSLLLLSPIAALLHACSGPAEPDFDALAAEVARHHAELVHAVYQDALVSAEAMLAAIDALIAAPSQAALDDARAAWLEARADYMPSEAFRFYGGPIDAIEGDINPWPLDEAYIDYVEGALSSGIINDPDAYPRLDAPTLRAANTAAGETSVAVGWHAVEFLLWGQDLREDGPGDRPWTDYLTDGTGTAAHQDRRGLYLHLTAEMLVDDLTQLVDAWAPGRDNYRAELLARPPKAAIADILLGISSLSGFETAGERLTVPYVTQEQEDEHSCFSDNTHADFQGNARGVQSVYSGVYRDLQGPGLHDLVLAFDPDLADRADQAIAAAVAACDAIPAPFDRAILADPGRPRVRDAIDATRVQTELLIEIGDLFDITLNIPSSE
jgi:putative iron-regulated protein